MATRAGCSRACPRVPLKQYNIAGRLRALRVEEVGGLSTSKETQDPRGQQATSAKQEQARLLERGVVVPGVGAPNPTEGAETAARHVIWRWHVIGRRGVQMVSGGNWAAP